MPPVRQTEGVREDTVEEEEEQKGEQEEEEEEEESGGDWRAAAKALMERRGGEEGYSPCGSPAGERQVMGERAELDGPVTPSHMRRFVSNVRKEKEMA